MSIPSLSEATRSEVTQADPRWGRVLARDRAADGQFFYAVATTGVYCRPSCPSRSANPGNVRFYDSAQDCAAAGYRPCRRCRPDGPSQASRDAEAVARGCRLIEAADQPPLLAQLARAAGLSAHHFHRLFKASTGVTPRQYAAARRAARLRDQLSASRTVTEAIYGAGFGSGGRFYAVCDDILGMTPSRYRAGGEGVQIGFAVGQCSLGAILVARSERGVCAITMGDDAEALVRDLQDRFPRARILGGEPGFEALVARVVGLVEAPAVGLDLPLDVRGTVFQQRVWRALRDIPAGQTATYAQIAARIGAPKAVRAVAGACAANPVAVVIPCHRVVRTGGALAGYRWGVQRKRALLDREAGQGPQG